MIDFLHENGEEILVLTGDYDKGNGDEPNYAVSRTLKYIDYTSGGYWDKSRIEKQNHKKTLDTIDIFNPDVVYFWNQQYISIAPYLAVKKRKLKHLFDIGDIWPEKYKREGYKDKLKSFVKRILPNFIEGDLILDPVIILSEWMREIVTRTFSSRSIYVIPRGVLSNRNYSRNLNPKNIKLMFASRIEPLKGLELLIKILKKVKCENWTLNVYGDGDEDYVVKIKRLIKELNLTNKINLRGKVYPLDKAYAEHDVFIFPTMAREGFGRVVIESMSFGLPVISVDRFGPADIIKNGYNGFKCSIDKPEEWVRSIETILSNEKLLSTMSENSLDTVKKKYDINFVHNERYKIIKEIHSSKRG
jgi:glycosyltransferase involved in cell wall biosynthesis